MATPNCLALPAHFTRLPSSFARPSAGKSMAARMAIMAMTTNNSISVKARRLADNFILLYDCGATAKIQNVWNVQRSLGRLVRYRALNIASDSETSAAVLG